MQVLEKEKLLSERNQLQLCMSELWQNLSFLSQQVCKEVRGGQPASVSTSIDLTSESPSACSDQNSVRAGPLLSQLGKTRKGSEGLELPGRGKVNQKLVLGSTEEVCSPTVTMDFCQEMTQKCRTEEPNSSDPS